MYVACLLYSSVNGRFGEFPMLVSSGERCRRHWGSGVLKEDGFLWISGPAVQFADLLVGAFFTYEQPYRLCFQRGCNRFRSVQQHRGVLFSPHGENL